MGRMITLRGVPESVYHILKSRAACEGLSLSDFIKRELKRVAERPTMQEWLERTQQVKPICGKASVAKLMRTLRDE